MWPAIERSHDKLRFAVSLILCITGLDRMTPCNSQQILVPRDWHAPISEQGHDKKLAAPLQECVLKTGGKLDRHLTGTEATGIVTKTRRKHRAIQSKAV